MFKHLSRKGALEAIQFQHQSPLFREVTTLCEEVFSLIPAEAIGYSKDVDNAANIMKKIRFGDALGKIVEKYTGLHIDRFHIGDAGSPNAWMLCHPKLNTNDEDEMWYQLIGARLRKDGLLKDYSMWREYLSVGQVMDLMIETANSHYDPKSGVISRNISDLFNIETQLEACFFVASKYHVDLDPFTAPMVAAIILHEIGHAITDIETLVWMWRCSCVNHDVVRYEDAHITPDNAVEALTSTLSVLKKAIKQTSDVRDLSKSISSIIEQINKGEVKFDKPEDIILVKYLCKVGAATAVSNIQYDRLEKISDLAETMTANTATERGADEYSIRHGSVGDLSNAMRIMFQMYEVNPFGNTANASGVARALRALANGFATFQAAFDTSQTCISSSYDPIIERLRQMSQNAMAGLKDPNIDKASRDIMIAAIRESLVSLDKYKSQKYVKFRQWFTSFTSKGGRLAFAPLVVLFNDRMNEDKTLQEFTSDMVRNEASYHAARVDALINPKS